MTLRPRRPGLIAGIGPHGDTFHTFPTGQSHTHRLNFSEAVLNIQTDVTGTVFANVLNIIVPAGTKTVFCYATFNYLLVGAGAAGEVRLRRVTDNTVVGPDPYLLDLVASVHLVGAITGNSSIFDGLMKEFALQARVLAAGDTLRFRKAQFQTVQEPSL